MVNTTILIADDDTELLANLALHLRNEEYTVSCAADGFKVITDAQRAKPDVLLVAVGLMVDEYSSLCDELHQHSALRHIPTVYLVDERSVRLGNVPRVPSRLLVFKPVHTEDLFRKIELAVNAVNKCRVSVDPDRDDDGRELAA
jgi:PleD family two-component response regulator